MAYLAKASAEIAKETSSVAPDKPILNAPIALMDELNQGRDYQYDHGVEDSFQVRTIFRIPLIEWSSVIQWNGVLSVN